MKYFLHVAGSGTYEGCISSVAWMSGVTQSIDLATRVYRLTGTYPAAERYGLTAQMRRAVVSVSSNIAEGAGRGSSRDMARFLRVAIGSICELESQLEVSRELGLVTDVEDLISKASLLKARIKTLEDRLLLPDT